MRSSSQGAPLERTLLDLRKALKRSPQGPNSRPYETSKRSAQVRYRAGLLGAPMDGGQSADGWSVVGRSVSRSVNQPIRLSGS